MSVGWPLGLVARARSAVLVLAASAAACSSPDRPPKLNVGGGAPPTQRLPPRTDDFVTTECPFAKPSSHVIECGVLSVPESRASSASRLIELQVAIVYSSDDNPAPDPIIYLEGGPGGAAIANVLGQGVAFSNLLRERDLIVLDQRGTGFSEPWLGCPELDRLGAVDPDDTVAALEAISSCRARLIAEGIDLAAYDSAENAADVEDLRRALGYAGWNLYGISYGTRLALTVLRDHPDGVRSAVVDAVLPLEADFYADEPLHAQRAFDLVIAGCGAQAECGSAFPTLDTHLWELIARLDATPQPLELKGGDHALLSGGTLLEILFLAMYSAEVIPYLPAIIELAYGGDYEFFQIVVDALNGTSLVSYGMYYSVMCADEIAFSSREVLAAAAASVEPAVARTFGSGVVFDVCELWKVPASPSIENDAVVAATPALVLSGEYDPITPPVYAERVAAALSAAQSFVLADQAHGASVSACGQRLVADFFRDPASSVDASCVEALQAPNFTRSFSQQLRSATPRFVARRERPPEEALADLEERLRRWSVRPRAR
jgi:pimeloyl-ACP methyl ester carboxylesterase